VQTVEKPEVVSTLLKAHWELYVTPTLTISNSAFCTCGFSMIHNANGDYFLKQLRLIFVMEKCGVFFVVRTEFLNIT
jgi:hypothetical protein